jgi:hypothetical protein
LIDFLLILFSRESNDFIADVVKKSDTPCWLGLRAHLCARATTGHAAAAPPRN